MCRAVVETLIRQNARARTFALSLVAVWSIAAPSPALAQSTDAQPPRLEGFLAPDHWARLALRRAAAEGLAPVAWIAAPWSARLSAVRRTLEGAVENAPADSEARAALSGILARLEADHGKAPRDGPVLNVRLDVGASAHRGERSTGLAFPSADGFDYTPPPAVPDSSRALSRVSGFAGVGPVVAGFDIETGAGLRQLDLSVRAGPLDIRLGRQPLAFGPGGDEGIVLGPRVAFDGLGIALPDAFALPSFLRTLGGVRASLLVARMDASGDVAHPWFAAGRISFEPSPSWVVGLNRAVIFGGEGNQAITARRLALLVLGFRDTRGKDSDFENQVASVDVTARLGGPLALLGYVELGIDDIGGSIDRLPGVLAGIEASRIPGTPRLALGAELSGFVGPCCGYPPWYRHGRLAAGWSDRGRLLGHALGGHGGEAAFTWRIDPGPAGFLGSGRFFVRHRSAENVFAPDWQGASAGGRLRFSWPLSSRIRLEGGGEFETGSGWHRWRADVALGGWFRRSAAA